MKNIILAVVVMIATTKVAQCQIYDEKIREIQDFFARNSAIKNVTEDPDVEGSPYIQDEFYPITLKGLKAIIAAKFDAYNGQMHVKVDNEVIALDINSDYEVNFINQNKTYKTFSYKSLTRPLNRGFLVVVKETDRFKLLKEEVIIFKDKVRSKNSYQREVPAKFIRDSDVYYYSFNDKISHFPTKKKDLLKAYPKQSKKLKEYIRENKLSTKKEEDLIKIGEYISTL